MTKKIQKFVLPMIFLGLACCIVLAVTKTPSEEVSEQLYFSVEQTPIHIKVAEPILTPRPTSVFVVKSTPQPTLCLKLYSNEIKVLVDEQIKISIIEELEVLQEEIIILSKILYREARSKKIPAMEKAAVIWCVLNRLDSGEYGETIKKVATAKSQFAWEENTPVWEELQVIVEDVLVRWMLEREGYNNVGRVLPKEYLFFAGYNGRNRFRTGYRTQDYWDWSLPDPYCNTQ